MIKKELIENTLEKILDGTDKFIVDILVQPSNKVFVFIDGDTSVTIGDCQQMSRSIEEVLDRDFEDYDLTVSSSGIDRPIKMIRQYRKTVGKELDVVLHSGEGIKGLLVKADENEIEIEHQVKKKEPKKENAHLPYSEIKTAKIIVKFGK
jgi:ribosome maturation factor RimP